MAQNCTKPYLLSNNKHNMTCKGLEQERLWGEL